MTKYIDQERARYWPVSKKLMAQYKDGTHTGKDGCGYLYWRKKNGLLHRDGDLPAWIGKNGNLSWYQNDQRHRDGDKPAFIGRDGYLGWWQNGQPHRFRGPARIHRSGILEWWINHKNITQEVNEWLNGEEWLGTPEQIFEFQLRFT